MPHCSSPHLCMHCPYLSQNDLSVLAACNFWDPVQAYESGTLVSDAHKAAAHLHLRCCPKAVLLYERVCCGEIRVQCACIPDVSGTYAGIVA